MNKKTLKQLFEQRTEKEKNIITKDSLTDLGLVLLKEQLISKFFYDRQQNKQQALEELIVFVNELLELRNISDMVDLKKVHGQ